MFRLKIQRIERTCLFELSWGSGQQLNAQLPFPDRLTTLYQTWQTAYLNFYKTELRARVQGSGSLDAPTVDWRSQLVQAEATLLSEFHYWLNSAELREIRATIGRAAIEPGTGPEVGAEVEVGLVCEPLELSRFPWEAWELGTEFGAAGPIRFARTPANIRAAHQARRGSGRVRILAILGDDTGLNFQADRAAMQSLSRLAEIEFVGWQQGQDASGLKEQIAAAIADERGWDILFFAGHSNETNLTGGELAIAPGQSILVQEIAPQLQRARDQGLQFAIFNSCNGLSIANALIDLGLSQVAIMREPIHNRVAQEFLLRFVQHLAEYQDAHASLLAACQFLKLERNLTYPSAYLIPSLFRHPRSKPFRLEPFGAMQSARRWLPSRKKGAALAALTGLSLLAPVQSLLMETRLWAQAVYRQQTQQLPPAQPPVLLVQIDEDSVRGLDARKINPIDRSYLAQVLDRATALQPRSIGIDFLLDRPTAEDPQLAQAVQRATQQQIWQVFAATSQANGKLVGVLPSIASTAWSLQGDVNILPWYLELPSPTDPTEPFAQRLAQVSGSRRMTPTTKPDRPLYLSPLTQASHYLGQEWLRPILDFSVPPDRIFLPLAAKDLLDGNRPPGPLPPIVMIAAGGYKEAGLNGQGEDNFPTPLAVAHWRQQSPAGQRFTGAEAHAYGVHHLLRDHRIIPIPDLWMMGLAAIAGQGVVLFWQRRNPKQRRSVMMLIVVMLGYGALGLQTYISSHLLLPWLLPSLVFGLYILPSLRKRHGSF
jgi:CHASE2 domain/CHAT domain